MLYHFRIIFNPVYGIAIKFKAIYFHDLTYNFYTSYVDSLKTITPAQLLETANKYFIEDQLFEVVVGDK